MLQLIVSFFFFPPFSYSWWLFWARMRSFLGQLSFVAFGHSSSSSSPSSSRGGNSSSSALSLLLLAWGGRISEAPSSFNIPTVASCRFVPVAHRTARTKFRNSLLSPLYMFLFFLLRDSRMLLGILFA